ncbi:S1C family serine protease, partial [Actinomadura sediminis]
PGGPPSGPPPAPMGAPPGGPHAAGFGSPAPNWAPVPAPPPSSRTGPGLGLLAVIALIVALVAGAVGAGVGVIATDGDDGAVSLGGGSGSAGGAAPNRPPDSVAGVAARVLPSVVMIRVQAPQGEVGGTGFIVEGGYIITNNHVVSGGGAGGRIEVVFNDKKTLPATIKGTDSGTDIAVIKPEGNHELKPLPLGDSAALAVGDPVIAIGSPLGLQGSVTTGIVSSLNRAVPVGGEGGGDSSYLNAIQTDAAINPGNSGGPLVDMKGRVIGINTAIATLGGQSMGGEQQGGNIGLGFAIPINQGKRIAEEIIATGKVRQALLGVLPDPRYQQGGARILPEPIQGQQPVTPNGPADKAGIKPGDVITKIDGRPIQDATDLIAQIRSRAPGDQVKVTYERDGRESTVTVTLGASS